MDKQGEESEAELEDQWWESIIADISRLNSKVDFLISYLGFWYLVSSSPVVDQKTGMVSSSQGGALDLSYILL